MKNEMKKTLVTWAMLSVTAGVSHAAPIALANIDIMPMYNQESVDSWGNDGGAESRLRLEILKNIGICNKVLLNSQVNLRVNTVNLRKVDLLINGQKGIFWYEASQATDRLGVLEAERQNIGADLLTFVAPYNGCGEGSQPGWRSIVNTGCLFFPALAHEIMHNFNADHRAGYGFTGNDGISYKTFMGGSGRNTIWYLSNPLVTYQGVPLDGPWVGDNVVRVQEELARDDRPWWSTLKPWAAPGWTRWHVVNRATGKVLGRTWYSQDQQAVQYTDMSAQSGVQNVDPDYTDTYTYHVGMDGIRRWGFFKKELSWDNEFFYIESFRGDVRCLQIPDGPDMGAPGQPMIVAARAVAPRGQFYLEETDDGYYYIKNRQSNLYLHVPHRYPAEGEGLIQWWGGSRTKSQWYLRSE